MKKRNIIILIILVVAGIGAYIGITKFRESTTDHSKKEAKFVITANELIAAFDKDSSHAAKTYVDQLLEVTGNVMRVDSTGSIVLGEEGEASSVTVSLDRRHIEDHKKLQPGIQGTLKGICTGYSKGSGEDLLSSLGTTVELNFASVQNKK
jgi:hypothetical protein